MTLSTQLLLTATLMGGLLGAEPMETRIFRLNQGPGLFATFEPLTETRESVALQATGLRDMTTIKDVLEEIIPSVGESSMLMDERSGALIVTHVPYYLRQIETLLEQLDVIPLQVLVMETGRTRIDPLNSSTRGAWRAMNKPGHKPHWRLIIGAPTLKKSASHLERIAS